MLFAGALVCPDGREQTILDVPNKFDFNWQIQYELGEPLHIPAGSKILGSGSTTTPRRTSGTRHRISKC